MTFTSADDMRSNSRNTTIINNEVTAIENSITASSSNGRYECFVTNTTMTSSSTGGPYFNVWMNMDSTNTSYDQYALFDQMKQVMKTFEDLGYGIQRIKVPDQSLFKWKVEW